MCCALRTAPCADTVSSFLVFHHAVLSPRNPSLLIDSPLFVGLRFLVQVILDDGWLGGTGLDGVGQPGMVSGIVIRVLPCRSEGPSRSLGLEGEAVLFRGGFGSQWFSDGL